MIGAALDSLRDVIDVSDMDLDLTPGPSGIDRATAAARGCDVLIVAGGDGTLHAAAPVLLATGLPFGILPAGTANDLAHTLSIPADPAAAAQIILAGHTRSIDLGEVNGIPYFNAASIGMTVQLTRTLTREMKQRWGKAAYALAAARVALSARAFRATINGPDGSVDVRSLQIAVGNGRFYGGGNAVSEHASIDDGHLHLYSLETASAWRLLPMLWSLRNGTHGRWASVRTSVGDTFEVRTRSPHSVSADGEIICKTPATFRVLANALNVLAPPAA